MQLSFQTKPKCFIGIQWLQHLADSGLLTGPICWLLQAAPAWSGVSISPSWTLQIYAKGMPPAQRSCSGPAMLLQPFGPLRGGDKGRTTTVLCRRWLSRNSFLWLGLHLDDRLEPSGSTHRGYKPIFRAGQIRHLSPPSPRVHFSLQLNQALRTHRHTQRPVYIINRA